MLFPDLPLKSNPRAAHETSMGVAASSDECDEGGCGMKDDVTIATRSTCYSASSSVSMSSRGSFGTNHSGSAVSTSRTHHYVQTRTTRNSSTTRRHHRHTNNSSTATHKSNVSKNATTNKKRNTSKEPQFFLHGMTVESLDVSSFPSLLGSMVNDHGSSQRSSNSNNSKNSNNSNKSTISQYRSTSNNTSNSNNNSNNNNNSSYRSAPSRTATPMPTQSHKSTASSSSSTTAATLQQQQYAQSRMATPAPTSSQPPRQRSSKKFNPHAALKNLNATTTIRPLPAASRQHASSLPAHRPPLPPPGRPTSAMSNPPIRGKGSSNQHQHQQHNTLRSSSLIAVGKDVRTLQEVKAAMRDINEQKDDECLPAPWYETEMKVAHYLRSKKGHIKTTPMEFPTKHGSSTPDDPLAVPLSVSQDTAYLERLYDLRTWNMYKLISEARQDGSYQPSSPNQSMQSSYDAAMADVEPSSQDMMFDME